ncbi:ABC-2 transporter permease [Haloimpatiens sp. FM7330]|uniref:ABC-2 transporter permease n=1 Tax=Haloimpatiens sp. FM7330 TaxID=3298610 RepID=UPI00363D0A6D
MKDFMLSTKVNIFLFIYSIFISIAGITFGKSPGILYIFAMMMFSYISVLYTNGYDDKNNSEIILNSFPLDRKTIVSSKYLSLIFFIILSGFLIVFFTNAAVLLGVKATARTANLWDIIITFNITALFFSIYYPVYFKFGGHKLKLLNNLIYMLIIILPAMASKILKKYYSTDFVQWLINLSFHQISLVFAGIILIILFLSLKLSQKIYSSREF